MQLGLDSADRLAAALHEAQEPLALAAAARLLLRSPKVPADLPAPGTAGRTASVSPVVMSMNRYCRPHVVLLVAALL